MIAAVTRVLIAGLVACGAASALAQGQADPRERVAAQREAMRALAYMDGVWRGTASTLLPGGERRTVTQTERIGTFLQGTLKVIEGRGYTADGEIGFNALGIVSYDPDKRTFAMRSYAHGRAGDFALTPSADGFVWEIPAGAASIRYTATIRDGRWREIGERVVPGGQPVAFFEMNLTRIGDTDWPGAGAPAPQ